MAIILHVLIALTSIGLTSYAYLRPSTSKLRGAYGMVALTLLSGFYLVWTMPAHMLQACTSGLVYIGVVSVGIVAVHTKLVRIAKRERVE